MSKFLRLFFVTIALMLFPVIAQASCNIVIDGEEFICKDANGNVIDPIVENGTTYVPVRAIAEAFDTSVTWDNDTRTVFLSSTEGSPVLNDYINIFFGGKEFVCYDVNYNRVYPILHNSTTFLPLRGIGQLFGKLISWDDVTKTAILITPPKTDALSYLSDSVQNTAKLNNITSTVNFNGNISYQGNVVSHVSSIGEEVYSTAGFSLSEFLPEDYLSYASYKGGGKYFILATSSKLSESPYIQKVLLKRGITTIFSPLYIHLSTNGGYITDITIDCTGKVDYNSVIFDESFTITSKLSYPESFLFPLIPFPDKPLEDSEENVSAQIGTDSDAVALSARINEFVTHSLHVETNKLLGLLHPSDYNTLFGNKSASQSKLLLNTLYKKLSALYKHSDGSYMVDSLVYVKPGNYENSPEKAAKAILNIKYADGDESWIDEIMVIFIKRDGKWYLDPSIIENLI